MEDVVGFKRKSNNCYLFTGYEWIRVKSYDQTMLYFYEAGLTNHRGYCIDDFDWVGYWWKIGTDIWT